MTTIETEYQCHGPDSAFGLIPSSAMSSRRMMTLREADHRRDQLQAECGRYFRRAMWLAAIGSLLVLFYTAIGTDSRPLKTGLSAVFAIIGGGAIVREEISRRRSG
jgi:hypothetical protein